MDDFGINRTRVSIRAKALEKLSSCAVESNDSAALNSLTKVLSQRHDISKLPISGKEFEVLIALLGTLKDLKDKDQGMLLLRQLHPYLIESPTQEFGNSPSIRRNAASPWQLTTEMLTTALLHLATTFCRDDKSSLDFLFEYLNKISELLRTLSGPESTAVAVILVFSLLGFLSSLSKHSLLLSPDVNFRLIKEIRLVLSTDNLTKLETVLQTVTTGTVQRSSQQTLWLHYFNGTMGTKLEPCAILLNSYFCDYIKDVCQIYVHADSADDVVNSNLKKVDLIEQILLQDNRRKLIDRNKDIELLSALKDTALDLVDAVDSGADYIELASPHKVYAAFKIKSDVLQILGVALVYKLYPTSAAAALVNGCLEDSTLVDSRVIVSVYQMGSLLCFQNGPIVASLTKNYPNIVSSPLISAGVAVKISNACVYGLKLVSQDVVVSLIYSLINLLSADKDPSLATYGPRRQRTFLTIDQRSLSATDSFNGKTSLNNELPGLVGQLTPATSPSSIENKLSDSGYKNIVAGIVTIASGYDDEKITALAATVLTQKITKTKPEIDRQVVLGLSNLAVNLSEREFKLVLKSLTAIEASSSASHDSELLETIIQARLNISTFLSASPKNPLYSIYLKELLTAIVSKGDVQVLEHHRSHREISVAAEEISTLLDPLAALLPKSPDPPLEVKDWDMVSLFRNIWFNMVVHGFSRTSPLTEKYATSLGIIARSTPPLVSETSANKTESELELNTVLRRGSSHHNVNNQKEVIGNALALHNLEIRSISYPRFMFLAATVLLETVRVNDSGNCAKVLQYFGDPTFQSSDSGRYMTNIATEITKRYINNVIKGGKDEFTRDSAAAQLREMLILSCHRVHAIQDIAFGCCELLIKSIPSALCHSTSLYALLDLISLLWSSCLDAEMDEYEPQTIFVAPKTGITLELSDLYQRRRETLDKLIEKSREWIGLTLSYMSYDVRSLLTSYLSNRNENHDANHVDLGFTLALEMGGLITKADGELSEVPRTSRGYTDAASGFVSQYMWRTGLRQNLSSLDFSAESKLSSLTKEYSVDYSSVISKLEEILFEEKQIYVPISTIRGLMFLACRSLKYDATGIYIARLAVKIPFKYFTVSYMELGSTLWLWIANEVPELRATILAEISNRWEESIISRKGLFSKKHDKPGPEYSKMEYAPSSKAEIDYESKIVVKTIAPHQVLIRFLSSIFQSSLYDSKHILNIFTRIVILGMEGLVLASNHSLAFLVRLELISFAISVLKAHTKFASRLCHKLKELIMTYCLVWFRQPAKWPFGGNKLKLRTTSSILKDVSTFISQISVPSSDALAVCQKEVLLLFLDSELSSLVAWLDPLQLNNKYRETFGRNVLGQSGNITSTNVEHAWKLDPVLAVCLVERHKQNSTTRATLENLIKNHPVLVRSSEHALSYYLNATAKPVTSKGASDRTALLYWKPVSPIESVNLFSPKYGNDSFVLQYAMRSLESHDVNDTFFYVPQIVQALRTDQGGFVEKYILQTAKISQLFAHQIIWNILANSYRDEDSEIPDPMKPALDRVIQRMKDSFNEEEKTFYEREFSFFNEVTSISGKLKPYIKKSKGEKKAKIDEEMDKIKLDVGVYLPSNPDGTVVDIDRKSGRPLQSHAKAPFLAKFKIRREVTQLPGASTNRKQESNEPTGAQPLSESNGGSSSDLDGERSAKTVEVWQGAIFKVGDDCRQDMLALQIIAVFRSIFNASGLDLYVFPYRVTATAPGCGVIDVLPNSISRDMLGREAVNGLYEYFTSMHGGEDSIEFQRARNNFVKSLAAYSVISYLIQFKDRHNGNIMYDNDGHILHIDFGFCFDIVPGGVRFEAAPFKLTSEMVAVMGGSNKTQAYRWFEELCIKAFLASRPYAELIIAMVLPMLESGLPCFKGETTVKRLRNRFVLEKTDKEAALHFRSLIRKSAESMYTKGYDEFQRLTNGIPY